jgi:hypothetical protein
VKRRSLFLLGIALPLIAAGPPETLPLREATFTESSSGVRMRLTLPQLLSDYDSDALESIASGFATRLTYEIALFRWGRTRDPIRVIHRDVRVHWDPWNQQFVVESSDDGGPTSRRNYTLRADAVAAALTLNLRVATIPQLERGAENVYFVRVLGMRNPLRALDEHEDLSRGQARDVAVFSRWVGIFARARARAERVVEVRTTGFYLEVE